MEQNVFLSLCHNYKSFIGQKYFMSQTSFYFILFEMPSFFCKGVNQMNMSFEIFKTIIIQQSSLKLSNLAFKLRC